MVELTPVEPPDRFNRAKQNAFLTAYAQTGNITAAVRAAQIARESVRLWRMKDPDFRARFREAKREADDMLEAAARQRAIVGTRRPIYQGGKKVGEELVYSDNLLIVLLKASKPHKYRDNFAHEVTGRRGGPLQIEARAVAASDILTDPEIYRRTKELAQAIEAREEEQARELIDVEATPAHDEGSADAAPDPNA